MLEGQEVNSQKLHQDIEITTDAQFMRIAIHPQHTHLTSLLPTQLSMIPFPLLSFS